MYVAVIWMIEFRHYDKEMNLKVAEINIENAIDKGIDDREIRNELKQMQLRLNEIRSKMTENGDSDD